ncbi:plasmid recombination protein [Butyrivibrio sp. NC3005]|uniref:plasmid recombination protein n=1 Tax=Butyrivibrio sp. NC3005 TaxID=1280685 RepID=UPI000401413B
MKPLLREQLEYVKEIVPEFKIASAVTHLDEDSPHMHVVGVPVATGYKRGLSKQVAKTKVFDQERLEKIQDLMHDFVEHQMKDHPEIFGDETLMKKEFMRYATLENPKTTLGKIVSKAFKTFKEWWDKTKKPEIAEKAKTSILQKLRESQAIVDQRKEQQVPNLNRNNLRPER